MSTIVSDLHRQLAARLKLERETRGWTVNALAERSGVSRAMISKVERGEASPTAALLGRLSGAFGLTMSALLARAEGGDSRIARRGQQEVWVDPETGYARRRLSPAAGAPLELIEVELPARAEVTFPAAAYAFLHQQIWVRAGTLTFIEGGEEVRLARGDCLQLGPPSVCTFANRTGKACTYVVAVVRR